jgi:TPR repeat protein
MDRYINHQETQDISGSMVSSDWFLGASMRFCLRAHSEEYWKRAEQGNAQGKFRLGRMYQFGMALPQNRQEAIRWFDKASDQGYDQANYFANHT